MHRMKLAQGRRRPDHAVPAGKVDPAPATQVAIIFGSEAGWHFAARVQGLLPGATRVATHAAPTFAAFLADGFAAFGALVFIGPLGRCVRAIAVTWRRDDEPVPTLHLWARALCVGVGCTRGTPPEAFAHSAEAMLDAARVAPAAVRVVATAGCQQDEPALRRWAASLGARLRTFDDATLAVQPGVLPTRRGRAQIGLPAVAEAAALAAADQSELLLTRRKAALPEGHHHALAVALARRLQRRACIVGIGPGDVELISLRGWTCVMVPGIAVTPPPHAALAARERAGDWR